VPVRNLLGRTIRHCQSCPVGVGAARASVNIWGEIVEHLTFLKQNEAVHFDPERLKELYVQLGEAGAEDVVCRALEELAVRLSHTERCYREGRLPDMRKSARSLSEIWDLQDMSV